LSFNKSFEQENGYCEAGVSSGGILLKKEGRLGHSTQFGAAIWAEKREKASIAISLSGCGETLIRTHMAEIIAKFFFSKFIIFELKKNFFLIFSEKFFHISLRIYCLAF